MKIVRQMIGVALFVSPVMLFGLQAGIMGALIAWAVAFVVFSVMLIGIEMGIKP